MELEEDPDPAVITLLLQHGVDPNEDIKDGWTPLHLALAIAGPEVINVMLEHGGDFSISPPWDLTLSFIASKNPNLADSPELLQLLEDAE